MPDRKPSDEEVLAVAEQKRRAKFLEPPTPEQVAEYEARGQRMLDLRQTRAQLSEAEQLLAAGYERQLAAEAELRFAEHFQMPERARAAREMLARALRDQGRYKESYDLVPKESRLAALEGYARHDSDFDCGCQDTIVETKRGLKRATRWLKRTSVSTPEGDRHAWTCTKCLFTNVSPEMPPGYEYLDRARSEATRVEPDGTLDASRRSEHILPDAEV